MNIARINCKKIWYFNFLPKERITRKLVITYIQSDWFSINKIMGKEKFFESYSYKLAEFLNTEILVAINWIFRHFAKLWLQKYKEPFRRFVRSFRKELDNFDERFWDEFSTLLKKDVDGDYFSNLVIIKSLVHFLPKRLFEDREFVEALIKNNFEILDFLPENLLVIQIGQELFKELCLQEEKISEIYIPGVCKFFLTRRFTKF